MVTERQFETLWIAYRDLTKAARSYLTLVRPGPDDDELSAAAELDYELSFPYEDGSGDTL